jgi:hypothetical protein
MYWTGAHTKTAAAGLVSLIGAALLFRPQSLLAGALTVLLVTISVVATDKAWPRKPASR